MNPDERFENARINISFLEVYSWFLQLTDKEKEDFLRLINQSRPDLYNRGSMTPYERKCFCREDHNTTAS